MAENLRRAVRRSAPAPEPEPVAAPRRMGTAAARSRATANAELHTKRSSNTRYENTHIDSVQETNQDEMLEQVRFAPGEEPAFVRVSAGKTINLGNYESLRIDVSVSLPCLPEEIEDTYETGSAFVTEKMAIEEASWLGSSTRTASRRK